MINEFTTCVVCGKPVPAGRKTCSPECRSMRQRQVSLARWQSSGNKFTLSPDAIDIMHQYVDTHSNILQHLIAAILDRIGYIYEFDYCLNGIQYDIAVPSIKTVICADASVNVVAYRDVTNNLYSHKLDGYNITLNATQQGWRCIHWYDWDDIFQLPLLISRSRSIYARDCEVQEISKSESDIFLNMYHLQKVRRGSKCSLGLFYRGNLVQVMSFGYPWFNKHYEWELYRFCSDPEYRIVGGVSKLFKHFIQLENPESIITYCDTSKFSGDSYIKAGMTFRSRTAPSIIWSKGTDKMPTNILTRFSYDGMFGTNYGPEVNSYELMILNGWLPVYNCGQYTYEWHKPTPCI